MVDTSQVLYSIKKGVEVYKNWKKKTQADIQPSWQIKIKECIVSQEKFTKLVAVFFCCGDVF